MPSGDQSWAHQMDMDDELDDRRVEYENGMKILTEIRTINGKKIQVKQYYKTEKRRVSINVAKRKMWAKFGLSENDPPGPNPQTTFISDEVQMEFLNAKEEENAEKLANQANKNFDTTLQCRICGHNHWTIKCPLSTDLFAMSSKLDPTDSTKAGLEDRIRGRTGLSMMRDGRRMDMGTRGKDENNTIRITNLPEETQDSDIRDLFKDFGRIVRIFLAKDKATGNSKGFAFVSFDCRENAAKAIKAVNGHGYNNLILSVEWARPSGN